MSLDAQLEILEKQIALNLSKSFSISNDWLEVHRKNNVFLERNKNWLITSITILVSDLTNFSKTRVKDLILCIYTERNNWCHAHGTHKVLHTCQITIVKHANSSV